MATERIRDNNEDPLEQTELARRLRRMEWPPAPPEVKERVLRRIVSNDKQDPESAADADSSPDASHG